MTHKKFKNVCVYGTHTCTPTNMYICICIIIYMYMYEIFACTVPNERGDNMFIKWDFIQQGQNGCHGCTVVVVTKLVEMCIN